MVLTQALTLAQKKIINIYTDSKYAYNIIHSNILIWREREILTQRRNPIINGDLIQKLPDAAMLPSQAAIVHRRGHQRDGQYFSQGNNTADRMAKQAALKPLPSQNLFLTRDPPKPHTPQKSNKLSSPKWPQNNKADGT
jgi:ribonuclease HI